MNRVEPGIVRHGVTELGVVLHGARSERVHTEINRELTVRKPGEVGDQVTLRDFGDIDDVSVKVRRGNQIGQRGRGHARRSQLVGRATRHGHFEDRGLGLVSEERRRGRAATRECTTGHWPTAFRKTSTYRSISSFVRRSVTVTSSTSSSSPSIDGSGPDVNAATDTPPSTPSLAIVRRTSEASRPRRTANSRKNGCEEMAVAPSIFTSSSKR